MLLIGVNRSPYTRRVAITLTAYGVTYEQKCVSGFGEREEVRVANPLGRIPALMLDSGQTLVDSGAIIDHLDEVYGGDRPLTPIQTLSFPRFGLRDALQSTATYVSNRLTAARLSVRRAGRGSAPRRRRLPPLRSARDR